MTTTTVTARASSYTVGVCQVYYDGYASTTTVGSLWSHGGLNWRVRRGGSIIHRVNGTPNFSWLHEEAAGADTVEAQAIDDAGNAGSWYTHTPTLSAWSAATNVQYVSHSGNNANAGTSSGAAVLTLAQAITNIKASWSTGGTNVIYIDRSATSYTCTTLWSGHTAAGRIAFVPYGSGDDPTIVMSSGSVVPGSGQNSVVIIDCSVDLAGGSLEPDSGITRTVPYDWVLLRSTFTGTTSVMLGEINLRSSTDRNNYTFSHVAIEDCTFEASGGSGGVFYLFGMACTSCVALRNVNFTPRPSAGHPMRVLNVRDWYFEGCTFNPGATGWKTRFQTAEQDGAASATCRITMVDCHYEYGTPEAHETVGSSGEEWHFNDWTQVNCNSILVFNRGGGGSGSSSFDCSRIMFRNCSGVDGVTLSPDATIGGVRSIAWIDCAFGFTTGGGGALNLWGPAAGYDDGSVTVKGCVAYWDQSGDPQPRTLFDINTMTMTTLEPKLAECDYNHLVRYNSGATYWLWDGGSTTTRTLAAWQSSSAFDDNSTVAPSTSLSWTTVPASGPMDPTLTAGSSYLDGIGWPRDYGVDLLGHLRDTATPFAGPHEYGATATPSDRDPGSGVSVGPSRGGMRVRLGGFLR